MAIQQSDIQYRLSGGASNTDPKASLGGAKSSSAAGAALFDRVSSIESVAGLTEFRCVYLHNAHASLTLTDARAFLTNSDSGRLAIGVGSSAVNGQEQGPLAGEAVAPAGITFSTPSDYAAGVQLGDIPPGGGRSIWLRRTIEAGAPAASCSGNVRVIGGTDE